MEINNKLMTSFHIFMGEIIFWGIFLVEMFAGRFMQLGLMTFVVVYRRRNVEVCLFAHLRDNHNAINNAHLFVKKTLLYAN